MKAQAYLAFKGNCENALNFYSKLFDATIENKQTYKDSKRDIPENYRHNLQHAELKGNGIHIMAYDAAPDTPLTSGNNIQMSVEINDKDQAQTIFNKLSENGIVHHEFREREWDALFGRCTDQFNIQWMVNCPLN